MLYPPSRVPISSAAAFVKVNAITGHCSSVLFGKVFRFAQGNFGKRHKKALGGARKSGAEGINMKLVSEYIPILICFVRFLSLYPDGS